MTTGDPDLDRALAHAESLHCPPVPGDLVSSPEFTVWLDGIHVGRAWRPDASTAHYLVRWPPSRLPN